MSKQKAVPRQVTMVRLPVPLRKRLAKIAYERSVQTGKSVSLSAIIIETVARGLEAA